ISLPSVDRPETTGQGDRQMAATTESLRCMACGHEYTEKAEPGEDRERSCPKCRSNSIRHLKNKPVKQAG
ncbi:MAG TPA: hypothetical protein VNI57_10015, partial [Candidatus Saccharimonadales bacterium]|nr:hypothetical protein [Candidatus Saccharimonadales bacterium]